MKWRWMTAMVLGLLSASRLGMATELRETFSCPPTEARPHTFWYWMSGNISREGLTADLEAMKRAGIGGAVIFNIGGHGTAGPVKVLSPQWRELMGHAIREAGRLGIEINLNNSMCGWSSSGGPWITPDLAMQKLTWSQTAVRGATIFDAVLAQPPAKLGYYRDVAVLAFPTPPDEQRPDPVPVITASDPRFNPARLLADQSATVGGGNWDGPQATPASAALLAAVPKGQTCFVQMEYPQPFAARSLHLAFDGPGSKGTLQASEDGTHWRPVQSFAPRNRASVDLAFAAAPVRYWRVVFAAEGSIRLTELQLSARCRISQWTGKAMFDAYGLDKPAFTDPAQAAPESGLIYRERIVDLTDRLEASGRLVWDVPPGHWTILRFGFTPTGSRTNPSPEGYNGLECDKFNAAALDVHFKHSLQPWFEDRELNPLIQYVHVDSYERGRRTGRPGCPRSSSGDGGTTCGPTCRC